MAEEPDNANLTASTQTGNEIADSRSARIRKRTLIVDAGGLVLLLSFARLALISFSPSSGDPLTLGDAAGLVESAAGIYIGLRLVMDG